jgi:hypothetical protein
LLRILVLLTSIALLSGCASVPPPSGQQFSALETPSQEHATVYLMRTFHPLGRGIWPNILVNGQHVANLTDGTYTVIRLAPGSYTIKTRTDPTFFYSKDWPSETTVAVLAGNRYFIDLYREIRTTRGILITNTVMTPTTDMDVTKYELRSLGEAEALRLLQPLFYDKPLVSVVASPQPR